MKDLRRYYSSLRINALRHQSPAAAAAVPDRFFILAPAVHKPARAWRGKVLAPVPMETYRHPSSFSSYLSSTRRGPGTTGGQAFVSLLFFRS